MPVLKRWTTCVVKDYLLIIFTQAGKTCWWMKCQVLSKKTGNTKRHSRDGRRAWWRTGALTQRFIVSHDKALITDLELWHSMWETNSDSIWVDCYTNSSVNGFMWTPDRIYPLMMLVNDCQLAKVSVSAPTEHVSHTQYLLNVSLSLLFLLCPPT